MKGGVILACLAVVCLNARADGIPSSAQQNCNLLAQTVSSTAIWRDNGVPISKAQANVEAVLVQMPATPDDKKKWHDAVATIYGSKISPDQLSDTLGSMCR